MEHNLPVASYIHIPESILEDAMEVKIKAEGRKEREKWVKMTVTCALFDNNKIFSTICRFPQLKHGETLQPGHSPSTACSFYANKVLLLIYSSSRESHRLISSSCFQKRQPMCNKLITLQFSANENNYFPPTMIVVRKIL